MILPAFSILPDRIDPLCFIGKIWNGIANLYGILVFSSFLLSFECVAMAYVSCIIQAVPWTPMIAVIPFLVAFSIYNLNRKTDESEDAINQRERFSFTKRYEFHLYYGALISLALSLILSVIYGIPSLLATAAPFIFGILYSFRMLPERLGYRRLKEIPAVKNIVVGLAWATLLAFLPVFLNSSTPDARSGITFLLFFMWGFMASLIPDIRDKAGDANAGVKTIPVLFGEERTRIFLTGVLIIIGIPLTAYSVLFLPPFTTIVLVAVNLYSHGCVYLLDRVEMRNVLADAISDGQYICLAFGIILFNTLYSGF
ncbi:MAG: prenyltransferase [Methanoregula sp. PtaU1.Bin051]|nr:MAG: prenyltransferase [Methanoregula sp. PtaU1.Bin051]